VKGHEGCADRIEKKIVEGQQRFNASNTESRRCGIVTSSMNALS
jgi:hypothetical protein